MGISLHRVTIRAMFPTCQHRPHQMHHPVSMYICIPTFLWLHTYVCALTWCIYTCGCTCTQIHVWRWYVSWVYSRPANQPHRHQWGQAEHIQWVAIWETGLWGHSLKTSSKVLSPLCRLHGTAARRKKRALPTLGCIISSLHCLAIFSTAL